MKALIGHGLIYPLSKHVRREPDLWLFGHQDGAFAGNSKYLFLWVLAHRPDIRAFWLTGDEPTFRRMRALGLPVHRKGTPAAIRLALRAGAYFFCHGAEDVSLPLSGGALLVNLWHGVGLKSLRLGNPNSLASIHSRGKTSRLKRILQMGALLNPDVLVTTSDFMQHHFCSQFGLPAGRCPQLGYPRLDAPLDPALAASMDRIEGDVRARLWIDGASEVYAYVPTYRDTRGEFLSRALPDLQRLEEALERRNALLYVKLHRHSCTGQRHAGTRLLPWPEGLDLNAALPQLSAMITDYSSVHYDYLFHRAAGSILYAFDEEDYIASDRSLIYPFRENTAGWRASCFEELIALIESGKGLEPHPDAARIRARFWGDEPGPASRRIVAHVEAMLAERYGSASTVTPPLPAASVPDPASAGRPGQAAPTATRSRAGTSLRENRGSAPAS